MENKAFIPLYMDMDIINNLFSVVVNEFVEEKTTSVKKQTTIMYNVPVSEFSRDIFGKYVKGDIKVQIVNESSKQRTNIEISKDIQIFMELKKILFKKNLIKYIEEKSKWDDIIENDFVVLKCRLFKNPILNYVEEAIHNLEMQSMFGIIPENKKGVVTIIDELKNYVNKVKDTNCIKYVTDEICTPKTRFIVPINCSCNMAKFDYTNSYEINILGKVISKNVKENYMDLYGNGIVDNELISYFNKTIFERSKQVLSIDSYCKKYMSVSGKYIDIIPLVFFI
ncbi:MAG: hypothetical protein PHX70_12890 [Clostridium sp.]|nr:hypothetical protein [Clostridium sp.]